VNEFSESDPCFDPALMEQLAAPAGAGPALRVALWADVAKLPHHVRRLVECIRSAPYVDILAVIAPPAQPIRRDSRSLLYDSYLRLVDARQPRDVLPDAEIDCSDLFTDVPRVPAGDLAAIQALQLDVLLCFGPLPPDAVRVLPASGAWAYHPGDSTQGFGDPPQSWELLRALPVTTVELQRLRAAGAAPEVLDRVTLSMVAGTSVSSSRSAAVWGSLHLALQRLRALHLADNAQPAVSQPTHAVRALRRPGNLDVVRWVVARASRSLKVRSRHRAEIPHWRVALRRAQPGLLDRAPGHELEGFNWLESPRGHFWADPFPQQVAGRDWLFVEDYQYATGYAGLSVMELDRQGQPLDTPVPIMQPPYHLSYPHVVQWEGEYYMIPESSAGGTVDLWRASEFPFHWRKECTLLEMRAVDTTLWYRDERWWLFTSPMVARNHVAVTLLYHAPRLTGPWTLHPVAPICSDVRQARGAGELLEYGGKLLRPAQDCAGAYGRALVFNEIMVMDTRRYSERLYRRVATPPGSKLFGVHTYNRGGGWEAVDGRVFRARSATT